VSIPRVPLRGYSDCFLPRVFSLVRNVDRTSETYGECTARGAFVSQMSATVASVYNRFLGSELLFDDLFSTDF
jgi:hypothetical protein